MPDMVNKHGIIVSVLDEHVADNLSRGLRMAEESDYIITESTRDAFRVGLIDNQAEGVLGTRPVQVIGHGRSRDLAKVRGAYRIVVNPRADAPNADACVALDDVYWDEYPDWCIDHPAAVCYAPRGTRTSKQVTRFTMPLHPAAPNSEKLAMRISGAIKTAHYSGVAGLLLARYLTKGPVILSGFDLHGSDHNGVSYMRQASGWTTVSEVFAGEPVYAHQSMIGPLSELMPTWLDSIVDPHHWAVVASGPSGKDWRRTDEMVATCNAGARRFANPHLYWLSDDNAGAKYAQLVDRIRDYGGHCVGRDKHGCEPFAYYPEDKSYHGRSSGVMALRAVLKLKQPRVVTLVGFDGWEDHEMEYYDRKNIKCSREGMNELMAEALRRIFAEYPEVEFRWHAETRLKRMVDDGPDSVQSSD